MKFEEALNSALDEMDKCSGIPTKEIKKATLIISSVIWNILAVSQNKLDDIVYIDDNNSILSFPLKKEGKKKKTGKKSSDKTTDKIQESAPGNDVVEDGKKEQKTKE